MQVNAIYEDGSINFVHPIRFKHRKFEVIVNIPDDELDLTAPTAEDIDSGTTAVAHASSIGDRVRAILKPYQHLLAQTKTNTSTDYKAEWHAHLEDKYLGHHEKSDT